ncbi:hypothetical protein M501DRAFT_371665 [Patellaria atrata CBS 101060]|uniref:Uncharacterized protein n=1 Tax=Patellaria atrata CBS 101060 TaxID=1346257 RepID=A0A9P4VTY4_9PEZI|nr:hypothetical protein M501DRAFT_371665 [Patellaria atrata CBS 101060]
MCRSISSSTILTIFGALVASVAAIPPDYWDVDLSLPYAPAPAPEDGVPGARNALRNKALLPAEICGIVGAYFVTVIFAGTCLLTYGRRRRRAAQASQGTLEVEMVKPANKQLAIDPSPISPGARSWLSMSSPSRLKHAFKKSTASVNTVQDISNPVSPAIASVASFDNTVLQSDRESRQKEMERLYAAVMEHDPSARSPVASISSPQKRHALTINTDTASQRHPSHPASPLSARSDIRAIYPPDSPMAARHHPPAYAKSPLSPRFPDSQRQHQSREYAPERAPASPRSMFTHKSRTSSIASGASGKSKRSALRNLRISAPMQRYPGQDEDDDARTPLSPRFDPGPPPPPPNEEPTSPHSPDTPGLDRPDGHRQNYEYDYEGLDRPAPLPRPAPQRGASYERLRAGSSQTPISAASTLRQYQTPLSPTTQTPTTKTTYLERKKEDLRGLRTPMTGVPQTPYSAYMPFTPVTPVTPHLVSREERKLKKKEAGRRVMVQEDLVEDAKEMWE